MCINGSNSNKYWAKIYDVTFPFGENATEYTGSLCLVRVCKQSPLSTSHNLNRIVFIKEIFPICI